MSLTVENLSVTLGERLILNDIDLEIKKGKIQVLMGPNGSGKSTLAQVLMGNPNYQIKDKRSKITIDEKNIIDLGPDERAKEGLFLAFQNPIAIPGVNVANLLRTAYRVVHQSGNPPNVEASQTIKPSISKHNPALSVWKFNELLVKHAQKLHIPQDFLRRSLNEEFSGGEKKKLEMLQAIILSPKYAIFDEIDTGLDVDALKITASGISQLKRENCGVLIITHYQRILKYAKPDYVHILVNGKMVESGGYKLAREVEKNGYKKWSRD